MFSWHVTVKETSVRLSQPSPVVPPSTSEDHVNTASPTAGSSLPPRLSPTATSLHRDNFNPQHSLDLSGPEDDDQDSERNVNDRTDCQVFRLVISRTDVRMGFRAEKGFVMEGSVVAISASGVGGATFFSINPAVLWGVDDGDSDGEEMLPDRPAGEELMSILKYGFTCVLPCCFDLLSCDPSPCVFVCVGVFSRSMWKLAYSLVHMLCLRIWISACLMLSLISAGSVRLVVVFVVDMIQYTIPSM